MVDVAAALRSCPLYDLASAVPFSLYLPGNWDFSPWDTPPGAPSPPHWPWCPPYCGAARRLWFRPPSPHDYSGGPRAIATQHARAGGNPPASFPLCTPHRICQPPRDPSTTSGTRL